ncbi:hypothetical protein PENVUL_c012G01243 [Penicillium vulpinum]|uniref:IBR domain-containing protein n=1 Tax=Penicillium vulpinum TaxID=29845 RepID=A0A1V6S179_9EURO|nr:hypothetical protein PENVUL_c012G01243 [Penicillium vulpinum]
MACILEVDQPTAELIVQIQLQDASSYSGTSKGKSRDPTDEELAFQLQMELLEVVSHTLQDRRMAMSIAAAVQVDGRILAETQVEEESASKDRLVARQCMDGEILIPPNDFEPETTCLDDETLEKLQFFCRCGAQFCYNCGQQWKNCECEQWDEHRLLARAYQIVDREEGHPLVATAPPNLPEPHLAERTATDIDEAHLEIQETQEEPPSIAPALAGMIDGNLYMGPIDVKNVLIIYGNTYLNVASAGSKPATAAEETDSSYSNWKNVVIRLLVLQIMGLSTIFWTAVTLIPDSHNY